MTSLVLIFVGISAGVVLRSTRTLPAQSAHVLGAILISFCLPAMTFLAGLRMHWSLDLLLPAVLPWLMLGLSMLFYIVILKSWRISRSARGVLIVLGGLGNTSFLGFPLLEWLYGKSALDIAILYDQFGSFLILSLPALILIAAYSVPPANTSHESQVRPSRSPKKVLRTVLTFPPLWGLAMGLCASSIRTVFDAGLGQAFFEVCERIAATVVPLALVCVGFQLKLKREHLRRRVQELGVGLLFKLLLSPLLALGICWLWQRTIGASIPVVQVSVLESGMSPMITAGIICGQMGLDEELASLLVGLGTLLSLFTIPLWAQIL